MSGLDNLLPPETPAPDRMGGDALVARAREIASTLLAPRAEETDQAAILPRENLEAVASAGLLGMSGPAEWGGQAAPGEVSREIAEILSGACGATHFVQAQHHGPVGMIARSGNAELKERYLRPLCEGRLLAGVAFSHLRRPGRPAVSAQPVSGGYRITGEAPWVTSWGLAGAFVIAGTTLEGQIVYFLQEGRPGEGIRPSEPLALATMGSTSTVRLAFDDLFVRDSAVISTTNAEEWRKRDRIATALVNPAVFGIARTCVDKLREAAKSSRSELTAKVADSLEDELNRCRREAYGLMDSKPGEGELPQLLSSKAWSQELVVRAAHAYVAAVGGRAMSRSHPAQRLMREAMFYTIQAQTTAVRDAALERILR